MQFSKLIVLQALAAACLALTAYGQTGAGGAGGQGGTGGTGGTATTTQGGVQAQGTVPTPGTGSAPGVGTGDVAIWPPGPGFVPQKPWFSSPGIRQQLNLNDQQFNALNSAYGTRFQQYQQQLNQLQQSTLTPDQRAAAIDRLNQQFELDFDNSLSQHLNQLPSQQRFRQLRNQYLGYGLFNNPQLQQPLELTPQQQTRLRVLQRQYEQQLDRLRRLYENDAERLQEQFARLQTERSTALQQLLNQRQYEAWQQMLGDPYDWSINDFPPTGAVPNAGGQGFAPANPGSNQNQPGNPAAGAGTATPGSNPGR